MGMSVVASVGNFILTGYDALIKLGGTIWTNETKHSSTFTNQSKSSTNWTNQTKS